MTEATLGYYHAQDLGATNEGTKSSTILGIEASLLVKDLYRGR